MLVFVLAEVSPWVLEHHQYQEGETLTLQKAGKRKRKFSRLSPQYPPHFREVGKTQSQSREKRSGEFPRDFYQPCSWWLCMCGF